MAARALLKGPIWWLPLKTASRLHQRPAGYDGEGFLQDVALLAQKLILPLQTTQLGIAVLGMAAAGEGLGPLAFQLAMPVVQPSLDQP